MGGDHDHSHPHSSSSSHDHEEMDSHHRQNLWLGFVAAAGIFFFFFTEKCLNLIGEWHKKYLKKKRAPVRYIYFFSLCLFNKILFGLFN